MKKLRVKVFLTIFTILTIFVFLIIATSTTRNYLEKKKSISEFLTNDLRRTENINRNKNSELGINKPPLEMVDNQDTKNIYLDFTVYTIILDQEGNYKDIINNTSSEDIDESKIKSVATKIINKHSDNFYIGNLYVNKYSYAFTSNNTLIIMDNSNINSLLIRGLITNILLFILSEVVIFVITYIITKWIIEPVKKSFEKQKIFVADASHELKTPLSVMIASADAYFNDKDDKWVYNMKSESERMIKLVTELLDLAKTEREYEIPMQENSLSDIIESSILTFESLFFESKIKLKYNIEQNINLLCNEDLIIELMSILIDNAIKHTKEKGKVFVNLYKNNKQIILEVKNSGLPITKGEEEKIFERFYKVDSSRNRNSNNYGLGLAIAKNIVEKHSGSISAHSSDGYTTFKVIWNQK